MALSMLRNRKVQENNDVANIGKPLGLAYVPPRGHYNEKSGKPSEGSPSGAPPLALCTAAMAADPAQPEHNTSASFLSARPEGTLAMSGG
eukprot:4496571-Amphidinium_carterae.1